jgi:hypothetical protein
LARIAYGSSDTRLFAVAPKMSHVSKQFAAGNTDFWTPVTIAAPPGAVRSPDKAPAKTALPSTKP